MTQQTPERMNTSWVYFSHNSISCTAHGEMHQERKRWCKKGKEKKMKKVPWLFKTETKHGLVQQKVFIVLEQGTHRQGGWVSGGGLTDTTVSNTMSQMFHAIPPNA